MANFAYERFGRSWRATRYYERAHAEIREGRWGDALPLLERSLAIDSHQVDRRIQLARARFETGDSVGAEAEITIVILRTSPSHEHHLFRGRVRRSMRNDSGADGDFAEAVRISPLDMESRLARAEFFRAKDQLSKAEIELEAALRIRNDDTVLVVLAKTEEELGKDSEAEPHLQAALPSGAVSALANALHGRLQLRKGDMAAAARDLELSSKIDSNHPEVHLLRGELHLRTRRTYEAQEDFEEVLRIRPNDPGAMRGLAIVAKRLGRWDAVHRFAGGYLQMRPDDDEVARLYHRSLFATERLEECISLLTDWIVMHPNDTAAVRERAIAYGRMGDRTSQASDLAYIEQIDPSRRRDDHEIGPHDP